MPSLNEQPILDLGINPIAGGNPCGIDASEEEEYIFATSEIAKFGRIEADEPEWYEIEQACELLLRDKSKDVEIAATYGAALFKRHGYEGLAAALGLLNNLVRTFWDNLFPERPRRRKARIESLTDRFPDGQWFGENPPKPNEFDAVDACVERISALDEALKEKMPDDPADFAKFKRGIKELAAKRPKPAAQAPPPGEPSAAGAAPAAASGAAGGGGGGFVAAEVTDKSGAVNAVLNSASFLRQADKADPLGYALVRVVKWSKLSLPTSDAAKYQIDPPEASVMETLEHQFKNCLWDNLLKNAEAAFRSNDPLWLDLQRYSCMALRGLGPGHEKAAEAIMSALAGLVQRLGDGLFELKFKTGQPLCGGETKMWIDAEVRADQGGGGGGGGAQSNGRLTEASDKAKKLAASGKLKEAMQELHHGLMECSQRRDRLMYRLRIAQLCFDSQKLQLADPLLQECYQEINKFGIGEWEPTLAVDVAQTLYRCRKSLMSAEKTPTPEMQEKVRESFAWLCQLDPLAALAVEPSGK